MVDFNNEATIGTPRGDILSVLILQRRNDVLEAIEAYNNLRYKGGEPSSSAVRARIGSLFLEVRSALRNSMKEKDFDALAKRVSSEEVSELEKALFAIDEWLYKKNITRIDTRKDVDNEDIEAVNKNHGL